jgi:hypothetical protein
MKKALPALLLLALGAAAPNASALCYTVFADRQEVLYRGSNPPIDLSRPISEGMRRTFPPGSILVIAEDDKLCTPIGPQNMFGQPASMTGPVEGTTGWQSGMTAGPRQAK